MKLNYSNTKKTTIIAISIIIIGAIALGIYFLPYFSQKREVILAQKIKSNNKIFTEKILEEFTHDKNAKASITAQKIVEELNSINKNPYDNKAKAYCFEKDCKACSSIEYNDELNMVIISTYDKKGDLSARTVIKPPSFVSYYKSDNE